MLKNTQKNTLAPGPSATQNDNVPS